MDKTVIGQTIKTRRRFLKISQSDLSDICNVSERTLRDIEKGIANPELDNILVICHALGLDLQLQIKAL